VTTGPKSLGMPPVKDRWLLAVCLVRTLLFANFMVVASCISEIVEVWQIGFAEAGTIGAGFLAGYAISLLGFSILADYIGARNSVLISAGAAAVSALAFAVLARSYESALYLYTLAGLTQGGIYTPLIMVFSDRYPENIRGARIGWLIASTSVGYALSLALSSAALSLADYRAAFLTTGIAPVLGAFILIAALLRIPNVRHARPRKSLQRTLWRRRFNNRPAIWLLTGYTAHCWELIGMWSWMPTFLATNAAANSARTTPSSEDGALVAACLHLTGAVAASSMGRLSDHWGRARVLFILAISGAALSFSLSWSLAAPSAFVMTACLLYAFVTIGDSPVLSTAITEVVPPAQLGRVLAVRSVLGFSIGATATYAFGLVIDLAAPRDMPVAAWGLAFGMLGLGGLGASYCASRFGNPPR